MFTLVSYCNPSASGRPAVVLMVHVGPEAQGVPDELHVAEPRGREQWRGALPIRHLGCKKRCGLNLNFELYLT